MARYQIGNKPLPEAMMAQSIDTYESLMGYFNIKMLSYLHNGINGTWEEGLTWSKTSSISHTKSQNLNVSCILL